MTTFGEDEADALRRAVGAIEEALAARMADGDDIPEGHQRGPRLVRLPALTVLKAELYRQLRDTGITRAELSRRLGWKRESVDPLFRLDHQPVRCRTCRDMWQGRLSCRNKGGAGTCSPLPRMRSQ